MTNNSVNKKASRKFNSSYGKKDLTDLMFNQLRSYCDQNYCLLTVNYYQSDSLCYYIVLKMGCHLNHNKKKSKIELRLKAAKDESAVVACRSRVE